MTQRIKATKVIGDLEWEIPSRSLERLTWDKANRLGASLGDGWRLPTLSELHSLVDYKAYEPACTVMPIFAETFWTFDVWVKRSDIHWAISFHAGHVSFFEDSCYMDTIYVRNIVRSS